MLSSWGRKEFLRSRGRRKGEGTAVIPHGCTRVVPAIHGVQEETTRWFGVTQAKYITIWGGGWVRLDGFRLCSYDHIYRLMLCSSTHPVLERTTSRFSLVAVSRPLSRVRFITGTF